MRGKRSACKEGNERLRKENNKFVLKSVGLKCRSGELAREGSGKEEGESIG